MRIVVLTGMAIALLTMPAYAQGAVPPYMSLPTDKPGEHKAPEEEHSGAKADDKAYKSALDGIQAPKQGSDPWHNVRAKPQSNNSAK